jgi:hypothetical protein
MKYIILPVEFKFFPKYLDKNFLYFYSCLIFNITLYRGKEDCSIDQKDEKGTTSI